MTKPNIVFDFDSVIARTIQSIIMTYINVHYEEIIEGKLQYPDFLSVRRWNMEDELPDCTVDELLKMFESKEFFNNLPFISDSDGYSMYDLLEELNKNINVELHIKSKGTERNLYLKRKWIQRNIPFFNIYNFEGMLGTDMNKESVNAHIAIDDNATNLLSMSNVEHKILYADKGLRCEWNDELFDDENYNRCDSVKQLRDKIYELLEME